VTDSWVGSPRKRSKFYGERSASLGILHSGMTLAAIFLGLWRALWLGLRVADSLGQHLAKLGLSLWRFAREGFCPCGHAHHMGMPEGGIKALKASLGCRDCLEKWFPESCDTHPTDSISWRCQGSRREEKLSHEAVETGKPISR
jgi:hypothetical protein